ncbi:NIN-like protein [Tanacetum coccineum]
MLIKRIFGVAYSEAIVARDSVNTTINCDVSLQITNDGVEKNNGFCRVCSFQSSEPLRNVSVESMLHKQVRGIVQLQWWSNRKRLKSIQANVVVSTSEEAPIMKASDGLADFKTAMREQFIENATASAVKQLTIKATYEENIVKFPFTLLDGLEKLKEKVATRFQLRLGSFKLKYVDEDGDMILVACDTDLMLLIGDPGQPINQPVTRLLVLLIAHA